MAQRRMAKAAAALALLAAGTGCALPGAGESPTAGAPPTVAVAATAEPPAVMPVKAGPHPGEAVYRQFCAACHDNAVETRSPTLATLRQMRASQVLDSLIIGKMRVQAEGMSGDQIREVSAWLGSTPDPSDFAWLEAMRCPAERAAPGGRAGAAPVVATFGYDLRNTRTLTAAQAGLAKADFGKLELAWALGFPGSTTMRAQPAVVGGTAYYPVTDSGWLIALDIAGDAPCVEWSYDAGGSLRTSASYGELPDGRKALAVGDLAGSVHLVDAATGALIWKRSIALFPMSLSTGTPVIHGGRVYAPVSQYEIMMGAANAHECCKSHGAVTALDAFTGEPLWTARTMPDATPQRDRGDGRMLWGPSGAPIWNSPALDLARGQLYVGTGEATSAPAHANTNAIMAIGLDKGDIRWSHQATPNDIFLAGCGPRPAEHLLNCERNTVYRDVDFGASMILAKRPDGRELVVGGQKSGTVWALDPETGEVVWRRDIGTGTPMGGVHWGIAANATHVFAPISSPGYGKDAEGLEPGLYAVNLTTGEIDWRFGAKADCSGDRRARMPACARTVGLSAAPTVIGDVVVAGALDGMLRAFDAGSGEVLFSYDTSVEQATLNGVAGKGGAIDAASIVAAEGLLLVNSGYGMFGQTPGNVLLAFRPAK
jgi:polyvinyl alcohol dehydrogenase (cytochrome)